METSLSNSEYDWYVIDKLKNVYSKHPGRHGSCVISDDGDQTDPNQTPLVVARAFIEKPQNLHLRRKYITALRAHRFGAYITLDVVSLEADFHRDIARKHLQGLGITQPPESAPVALSGGRLSVKGAGLLVFSGKSGDYGGRLLWADVNSVASFIAACCDLPTGTDYTIGGGLIHKLLTIQREHKGDEVFYSKLTKHLLKKTRHEELGPFSDGRLQALHAMKARDKARHKSSKRDTLTDDAATNLSELSLKQASKT